MKITRTKHTDAHWVFYDESGNKHAVGKYTQFEDGTFEGVATEQEAIDLLLGNGYTESDFE